MSATATELIMAGKKKTDLTAVLKRFTELRETARIMPTTMVNTTMSNA